MQIIEASTNSKLRDAFQAGRTLTTELTYLLNLTPSYRRHLLEDRNDIPLSIEYTKADILALGIPIIKSLYSTFHKVINTRRALINEIIIAMDGDFLDERIVQGAGITQSVNSQFLETCSNENLRQLGASYRKYFLSRVKIYRLLKNEPILAANLTEEVSVLLDGRTLDAEYAKTCSNADAKVLDKAYGRVILPRLTLLNMFDEYPDLVHHLAAEMTTILDGRTLDAEYAKTCSNGSIESLYIGYQTCIAIRLKLIKFLLKHRDLIHHLSDQLLETLEGSEFDEIFLRSCSNETIAIVLDFYYKTAIPAIILEKRSQLYIETLWDEAELEGTCPGFDELTTEQVKLLYLCMYLLLTTSALFNFLARSRAFG
jgi:hypothetical protein